MKKNLFAALVLAGAFLFTSPAAVSGTPNPFTTVTATVTDPNGIPYGNGTMSAVLVPGSPGGWTLNNNGVVLPYSGQINTVPLDSNGHFSANFGNNSQILPALSQWLITVNSNQGGIPGPFGTGPQTFSVTIAITGVTMDISATLNAAAPKLTNFATLGTVTTTGSPAANEFAIFSGPSSIGPASPCALLQPTANPTAGQVLDSAAPSGGTCQTNWINAGPSIPPIPFALTGTSVYARYLFRDGSGTSIADSSGNNRTGTIGACVNGTVTLNLGPAYGITATNANCSVTFPFNQSNYAAVLIYLTYNDPGNYMQQAAVVAGSQFGGMYQVLLGGTNAANNNNLILDLSNSAPGRQFNVLDIQPIGSGAPSTSPDGLNGVGMITFIPGSPDALYLNNQKVNSYAGYTPASSFGAMSAGNVQLFGTAWGITGIFSSMTVIGMEFLTVAPTQAQITAEWQAFQSLAQIEGYFPILATSQVNKLNLTGTSIVVGQGINGPMNYRLNLPGTVPWNVVNQAYSNTYIQLGSEDTLATLPQYLTPTAPWNIALNDGPTNDLRAGELATPEQALQYELSWCRAASRAGFYTIASTTLKAGTGSSDAIINQYNTLARASLPTVCNDVMDWAAQPNLGADGASSSGTYFQADHIHPTQISDDAYLGPYMSAHVQYDAAAFGTNAQPNIYKVGNAVFPYTVQPDYACTIGNPGVATATCTFPVTVTPGSTLGVAIQWLTGGPTISTVTDGPGDTFTADHASCVYPSGGNLNIVRYSAPNAVGGATTVTITFSSTAASSVNIFMTEDQRTATTSVIDVASGCGSTAGSQTTAITPSITTTVANDFLRASTFADSATGLSASVYTNPPLGWYQSGNFLPSVAGSGVQFTMNTQSMIARVAGAYTATANITPAAKMGIIVSALKPGTVGGTLYLNYADCGAGWQADPSGGSIQLNLPDAIPLVGKTCNGENIQTTGANTVTIGAAISGQTVNGTNTTLVIANLKHVTCRSVLVSASAAGANWDCESF